LIVLSLIILPVQVEAISGLIILLQEYLQAIGSVSLLPQGDRCSG